MMKKNRLIIASLSCAALALIAASIFFISAKTQNQEAAPSALIAGFAPGSEIEYKILSPGGLVFESKGTADQNGSLKFSYDNMPAKNDAYTVYDFQIQTPRGEAPIETLEDTLNVLLRVDNASGQITVSGNGIKEFSDILMTTPEKELRTSADWAGGFREKANLPTNAKDNREFQIAFYGAGALDIPSQTQSPAIIQVLAAEGGGTRDSVGVNQFTPSPKPLSTSNLEILQAQNSMIVNNYVAALMMMAQQLTAVGMQQMQIIGEFFDAKMQMETQRNFQSLKAQAVKDYHPSEEMCKIGSYMRSVATSEQKAEANTRALNNIMMSREMNLYSASTSEGYGVDVAARLKQFRTTYCDPKDNNDGLGWLCDHDQDPLNTGNKGATLTARINKDIDYYRTMAMPGSVDLNFEDATLTPDEEDVLALAKNLYWPIPLTFSRDKYLKDAATGFMSAKRVIALNNIAHASFANLAGMKSSAPEPAEGTEPGWAYMKTMLKDFGIPETEIEQMVGKRPSYWAQMDILTKKIYESPHFYTNLYDKPANIQRMSVALDAIKLMQMRDQFDSALRREMIASAMVETELEKAFNKAQGGLLSGD